MRTKDELFRIAQRQVAARRQRAVTLADAARAEAFATHPGLLAAQEEKTRCGARIVLLAARGAAPEKCAEAQQAFDAAAKALDAAITAAGCTPAEFAPAYRCALCGDTGTYRGRPCRCVDELARALRREEINAASPLALCGFETFELTRYPAEQEPELGCSPREYMTRLLEFSRRYAEGFGPHSRNLLFTGSAGLGKTHLALAIADAVLGRGYDVLYASSAALATQLGREQFERGGSDTWLDACKEADLLILDDLGTEFITPLTLSVLYELINTRMLCDRATVYTTNITDQAVFEARYTEKVASRIQGNCKIFKFFGADQRLK